MKAQIQFRNPVVATELRRQGGERFVGRGGELNASSKQDLFKQIAAFANAASEVGAVTEETATARAEIASKHREALLAAWHDRGAQTELGEVLAEELYQAANRSGFMRRLMARQDLKQGQFPQVRMRMKDVTAVVATSPVDVYRQLVRDNLYTPPEFYIVARPYVEQREIDQSLGDVLEEKYLEALEGTMVAEDRIWRNMALQAVGIANPLTLFSGTMNVSGMNTLRNQVTGWGLSARTWLIANDLWTDISADSSFQNAMDPVSQHELLMTGLLARLYGTEIVSDAFRHPQHKVLDQGEMFMVADPVTHGMYTDRGGVVSSPIDITTEKVPGRGWVMQQTTSMVLANARSVARGYRS